ncbi:hypothetical protein ACHAQA_007130 [Verticillium albo-atrum]
MRFTSLLSSLVLAGLVTAAPSSSAALEERQDNLPELILDKVRATRRTLSIMGPDVESVVRRAQTAWSGIHKEGADTFNWFWAINNGNLVTTCDTYVNTLLSGPRPTRRDIEVPEWALEWENKITGDDDSISKRQEELPEQVLNIVRAADRTLKGMRTDVIEFVRTAEQKWTGTSKRASQEFITYFEMWITDQIGTTEWYINYLLSNPRPSL